MVIQESYFYISLAVLIILNCFLLFHIFQLRKKITGFFSRGGDNLEKVFESQAKDLEKYGSKISEIFEKIEKLDKISKVSFQKFGIVRFNPFKEVGGDQSFSIALLDANNSGVVITSHYTREFNRVYAKSIIKGEASHSLSKEEEKAIDKAINLIYA